MDVMTHWAFKIATPLIVGFLTPFVVDALKRAVKWLDQSHSAIKQAAAIVVAGVATTLSTMLEMGVPTDLALWDETMVKTIVAGLLAIAIKQHKQLTKSK